MSEPAGRMNAQGELAAWITGWIVRELRLSPTQVAVERLFTSYGMDSVHAMMLVGDLEQHLARRLSPTLAWEYPTVEKLAEYLALLPPEAESDAAADLLARLDELPEEEIDRLLKERLGGGEAS